MLLLRNSIAFFVFSEDWGAMACTIACCKRFGGVSGQRVIAMFSLPYPIDSFFMDKDSHFLSHSVHVILAPHTLRNANAIYSSFSETHMTVAKRNKIAWWPKLPNQNKIANFLHHCRTDLFQTLHHWPICHKILIFQCIFFGKWTSNHNFLIILLVFKKVQFYEKKIHLPQ